MGCLLLIIALFLSFAVAGPLGPVLVLLLFGGWALLTGSVKLAVEIVSLPFRLIAGLLRR